MNNVNTMELNDTISYEEFVDWVNKNNWEIDGIKIKGTIITDGLDNIEWWDIVDDTNYILDILSFKNGYEPSYGESIVLLDFFDRKKTFLCSDEWLVLVYEYAY